MSTAYIIFLAITLLKNASTKPVLKIYQLDLSDQPSRSHDQRLSNLEKTILIDDKIIPKSFAPLPTYDNIKKLLKNRSYRQKLSGNKIFAPFNETIPDALRFMQLAQKRNDESAFVNRYASDSDETDSLSNVRLYLISNPEALAKAQSERSRNSEDQTSDDSSTSEDSSSNGGNKRHKAEKLNHLLRNLMNRRMTFKSESDDTSGSDSDMASKQPVTRARSVDHHILRSYRTSLPFGGGNRDIYE